MDGVDLEQRDSCMTLRNVPTALTRCSSAGSAASATSFGQQVIQNTITRSCRSGAIGGIASSIPVPPSPWRGDCPKEEELEGRLMNILKYRQPSKGSMCKSSSQPHANFLSPTSSANRSPCHLAALDAAGVNATSTLAGNQTQRRLPMADEISRQQELETLSRSFVDVERLLQETLACRKQPVAGDAVDPEEEEEERRRQREEEKRRQLQERQAARDPKRNMAMRLEVAREAAVKPKVPMRPVEFIGLKGHEHVSLVDVKLVQSKCMLLEGGANPASLMEYTKFRDRFAKTCPPGRGMSKSVSMPDISNHDSRLKKARAKVEGDRFNQVLQKLCATRSPSSEYALLRLEALANRVAANDAENRNDADGRGARSNVKNSETPFILKERIGDLLTPKAGDSIANRTGGVRRVFLASCLSNEKCELATDIAQQVDNHRAVDSGVPVVDVLAKMFGDKHGDVHKPRGKMGKSKTRMEIVLEKKAHRERLRKFWRQVRGVVKTLLVYFGHRRRTIAGDVVKTFLHQLAEADRIKYSVRLCAKKVRRVVEACGAYAEQKRKRLRELESKWQTLEDRYLAAYFNVYAFEVLELCGLSSAGGQKKETTNAALNWKRMRIPDKERMDILKRFYQASLAKRTAFLELVQKAKKMHGELWKCWTPETAARRADKYSYKDVPKAEPPPFWKLSEDEVLDLIAFSAAALSGVEPFRNHPALLASSTPQGSEITRLAEKLEAAKRIRGRFVRMNTRGSCECLRLPRHAAGHRKEKSGAESAQHGGNGTGKKESKKQAVAISSWSAVAANATSIDDLLACFTPRLSLAGDVAPDDEEEDVEPGALGEASGPPDP